MCKKHTSVSHSSTESDILSLDAGSRMDGIPALDLWDVVIEVLHSSKNTHQAVKGHCRKRNRSMIKCREVEHAVKSKALTPTTIQKRNCNREVDELSNLGLHMSQTQNLLNLEPSFDVRRQ